MEHRILDRISPFHPRFQLNLHLSVFFSAPSPVSAPITITRPVSGCGWRDSCICCSDLSLGEYSPANLRFRSCPLIGATLCLQNQCKARLLLNILQMLMLFICQIQPQGHVYYTCHHLLSLRTPRIGYRCLLQLCRSIQTRYLQSSSSNGDVR
jgi:hypothetical protein